MFQHPNGVFLRNFDMKTILMSSLLGWCALFFGCNATRNTNKEDSKQLTYLALGDSYTIGESVEVSDCYPNLFVEALKKEGISISDPMIIARTGWTTADLQNGIQDAVLQERTFDLVTLLIGVNNEFQHLSEHEYQLEFTQLLQQAIQFAGNTKEHVVVISIPDYGYTPYGKSRQTSISKRIDAFNTINKRITDSLEVNYVDITGISRNGLINPSLIAHDGLHPSGNMYRLWVDALLEEVNIKLLVNK